MDLFVVVLIVASIGVCVVIVYEALKNYLEMKRIVLETKANACVEFLAGGMIREEAFFYMVNDGEDLCEPQESIQYMDLTEHSSWFIGEK